MDHISNRGNQQFICSMVHMLQSNIVLFFIFVYGLLEKMSGGRDAEGERGVSGVLGACKSTSKELVASAEIF